MKLPIRLENAITKLYTAFHSRVLESMDCSMCAVGNICDNNYDWNIAIRTDVSLSSYSGITKINSRNINLCFMNETIKKSGYSVKELAEVELLFITKSLIETGKETKETQFKGLCAVVEYLCELDNVPNVMDYTKLFETENNEPKYQLTNQLN